MTDMELRDHFAGLAMTVFMDSSPEYEEVSRVIGDPEDIDDPENDIDLSERFFRYTARLAYLQADAMMREREKP